MPLFVSELFYNTRRFFGGLMVTLPGGTPVADCTIVKVSPAIVMVPLRFDVPVLSVTA